MDDSLIVLELGTREETKMTLIHYFALTDNK